MDLARDEPLVEVWILGVRPGSPDPVRGLMDTFGVDRPTAETVVASLPQAVKRWAPASRARTMLDALEGLGFDAELRAAPRGSSAAPPGTSGLPAAPQTGPASDPPPRISGAYRSFPRPEVGPGNLPSLPPPPQPAHLGDARSTRRDDTTIILKLQPKNDRALEPRKSRTSVLGLVAFSLAIATILWAIAISG